LVFPCEEMNGTSVLDKLTYEHFSGSLNQKFQIQHSGGSLEAELIECRLLSYPRSDNAQRDPFALVFRGPRQPVLAQQTYRFQGGSMGPQEIFIVPIGPDDVGMRYEAIFS
jgi:hypothetical protein